MSEKWMTRLGWALTGLYVAFMLGASILPKVAGMEVADTTMRELGWPDGYVLTIGLIELDVSAWTGLKLVQNGRMTSIRRTGLSALDARAMP